MKKLLFPIILTLIGLKDVNGQIIQMRNNLRGTSFNIPDFTLRLDTSRVDIKAQTVITCRSFEVTNTRNHLIMLWGDVTINCDLLELGDQRITIRLIPGVGKANFTIKYKHMDLIPSPNLNPEDGVNLAIVK